ncbi:hypothetical protein [Legionella israelensis]|uniref:GNAT family N-acetyltransferase n=1 Tax=Legionella israelensis TaxID=454 RepID=A0A0W0W658_9GAMM|nr:hypothetical protein [Legionella israelensis]KTD27861.1 hypothetical protein Lisr_0957 [Legionella israelensis]QBS09739.1 hypothetical protein E4T55_07630 [Legionella israelensis]SCY54588.1 hypothetical protein SAMN02746069_02814 [Legionella israelensis DSM 19235]STX59277.1 Uncharacterised protein [Legionella israelensis]
MVLVFDQKQVVGASTAISLEFEPEECQVPFIEQGMNIKDIFILVNRFYYRLIVVRISIAVFFRKREAVARQYGSQTATFCAVERSANDPRRPQVYIPLDQVWQHFGWREIGEKTMSMKPLVFWLKKLE